MSLLEEYNKISDQVLEAIQHDDYRTIDELTFRSCHVIRQAVMSDDDEVLRALTRR